MLQDLGLGVGCSEVTFRLTILSHSGWGSDWITVVVVSLGTLISVNYRGSPQPVARKKIGIIGRIGRAILPYRVTLMNAGS